ncbi:MAG: protease modulator HflC [Sneathiella sp.]|jgi:membrane protease subunit HflC|uniref:protease modulator HflC n=1 Tax=Sneathiella sp. TaxID=1964365 RepID=UPI000C5543E8|nr:protease modulator HflC [Sneathiella sp.]MAL78145.1 protease modulator HflC [Sneathiella sp.]
MNKTFLTVLAVLLVVIGFVAGGSLFTVQQTEQAIVMQFGEPKRVIQEPGLNFKLPFVQDVVYVDKRVLSVSTQREEVVTRDQKRLMVDSFARFRIANPLQYYQSYGNLQIAYQRLETILNSQMRQNLGRQILNSIVSGERSNLMNQIREQVNAEAKATGIDVIDVRIVRADLPKENSEKVFDRMRSQREQEAKEIRATGAEIAQRIKANADRERTVLVANARKDSEILRGEGDGEKNRIFADAFGKDEDFFAFYRSMQAYRGSMSDSDTSMVLSPTSEFFRYFDQQTTGDRATN